MMINFFFLFIFISKILTEEEIYESPCEAKHNPEKPNVCYGRSCEFIEETCCFLESISYNETTDSNETTYECIDFAISDYDRPAQKEIAIEQIKNGTYWLTCDDTYDEIIKLECNSWFVFPYSLLLIFLVF